MRDLQESLSAGREQSLRRELARLVEFRPLGGGWSVPELFYERAPIGELSVELVGLSSLSPDGVEVTAGAAETGDVSPVLRAYFELLERSAVVEAIGSGRASFPLVVPGARSGTREVPHERVFPVSSDPSRAYSRSSGVAAHVDLSRAARGARLELVERDRVLRSWFGGSVPTRLEHCERLMPPSWHEFYRFDVRRFGEATDLDPTEVVGVFGFARAPGVPPMLGFAAGMSLPEAFERASAEAIQRTGFLWGEPIGDDEPELEPTADYHQEVFLRPGRWDGIRDWLAGARQGAERVPPLVEGDIELVDLTPARHASRLVVVRAISASRLPLVFGRGHPMVGGGESGLSVHPIA